MNVRYAMYHLNTALVLINTIEYTLVLVFNIRPSYIFINVKQSYSCEYSITARGPQQVSTPQATSKLSPSPFSEKFQLFPRRGLSPRIYFYLRPQCLYFKENTVFLLCVKKMKMMKWLTKRNMIPRILLQNKSHTYTYIRYRMHTGTKPSRCALTMRPFYCSQN